jgi:hypothetical protein
MVKSGFGSRTALNLHFRLFVEKTFDGFMGILWAQFHSTSELEELDFSKRRRKEKNSESGSKPKIKPETSQEQKESYAAYARKNGELNNMNTNLRNDCKKDVCEFSVFSHFLDEQNQKTRYCDT